jgi:hypothetical protein
MEPIRWAGAHSISEAWLIMNASAREEHQKGLGSLFILIAQEGAQPENFLRIVRPIATSSSLGSEMKPVHGHSQELNPCGN